MRSIGKSAVACLVAFATLIAMALSGSVATRAVAADATRTVIDSSNSTAVAQLFKDEAKTQPIDSTTPVNRGDTLYGSLNITFTAGFPTVDQTALEYDFPSTINVADMAQKQLYSDSGDVAGTWSISGDKILVDYDKTFLESHTSGIKLHFDFNFQVSSDASNGQNQTTIDFPGGASAVISFNPAKVDAVKSAAVAADGKTVHFTTTFTADSDTTDFAFADSMQDGMTFVPGTFAFDSTALPDSSVTVDNTASPRTAGATIGKLTKGTHTLTYDAVLTDAAQQALLTGSTPNLQNTINYTWDKNSSGQAQTTPAISFVGVKKAYVQYHDSTGIADWKITVNSGTYKADMAGMTVTDDLLAAQKLGDGTDPAGSPAQAYTGSYIVKDSAGNQIGTAVLDPSKQSFSYTFPTDKAYTGTYTIEYSTKLTDPNVQRQYNNDAILSEDGTQYGKDTAQYKRTGGFTDVYKANPTRNSDGTISWTVKVNSGTFKRDFGGVTFSDTLQDMTPGMTYVGNYTVTRVSDGTAIATAALPASGKSFDYTFPSDAGYQSYTITYTTKLDDPTYLVNYANTATVSGGTIPGTDATSQSHYDNTYSGQDSTFITKTVTSDDAIDSGVVGWKVEVKPGIITDNSHLTFIDHLTGNWSASGVDYDHGSLKINGVNIADQSDVSVAWGRYSAAGNGTAASCEPQSGSNQANAPCFSLTLSNAALSYKAIDVTYTTTAQNPNVAGTYGNTATLTKDSASFSASDSVNVPQNAIAKSGKATWDSATKTWGINYTVDVNKNLDGSLNRAGIDNLHGKPVTLTDTLSPDSTGHAQTYVQGSASYTLTLTGQQPMTKSIDPGISQDGTVLTFTIPTQDICGTTDETACYAAIQLNYRVTVPTDPYRTSDYDNAISGKSDDATFVDGKSTTTVDTNVLVKDGEQIPGQPQVGYTIKVNEHGSTLNSGSPIELADSLDYRTSLVSSSVLVCSGDITVDQNTGAGSCAGGSSSDITSSSEVRQSIGTDGDKNPVDVLNVTVPDATYASVFYRAVLNGKTGTTLSGISNSAELKGIVNSGIENTKDFVVLRASGGTSGATGSISVHKIDSQSATQGLSGAQFTLYRVTDASWTGESDVSDHAVQVDQQTTDSSGGVSFAKDGSTSLKLNTLYYFVESKAPQGYHLDATKRFFILEDYSDTTGFNSLMMSAKDKLGEYPALRSYYTVADDKLTPVSFAISADKKLTGRALKAQEFTFSLHEGDANGKVVQTAKNTADGSIDFAPISYDHEGSFAYTITEDSGSLGGVTYSTQSVPVTVTAKDDGTGKLVATPSYGANAPEIDNTYNATGSFTPAGVKVLNGRDPIASDSFGFTVTDSSTGKVVSTGKVADLSASHDISFTPITYGLADAGKTFHYVVSENSTDADGKSILPEGVSATTGSQNFAVSVSDNGDGTLKATPTYPDSADGLTFVNTYSTSQQVPVDVNGTKVLLADGTDTTIANFGSAFTFSITGVDDAGKDAPLPTDADGTTVSSVSNDSIGNVDFGTITYHQSDLADAKQSADGSREKTFHYTVTEASKQPAGVTADASLTRHFDVLVRDDGQGHMTAVATALSDASDDSHGAGSATGDSQTTDQSAQDTADGASTGLFEFHNTYAVTPVASSVSDALSISKELKNQQLRGGQFTFLLTDKQTGKTLQAVTNDAKGAVRFAAISYAKPGTYSYTVSEKIPESAVKNAAGTYVYDDVTYDSTVYDVTVTVSDNHDGTLTAATTRTDSQGARMAGKTITFVNVAPLPTPVLADTGAAIPALLLAFMATGLILGGVRFALSGPRSGPGRHGNRRR